MAFKRPLLPHIFFPAASPGLPVRRPDDPDGPEYVIRASIMAQHERGLSLAGTTQTGKPVHIALSIVAPGIARVLLEGEVPDPNRVRLAGDLRPQRLDLIATREVGLDELPGQFQPYIDGAIVGRTIVRLA